MADTPNPFVREPDVGEQGAREPTLIDASGGTGIPPAQDLTREGDAQRLGDRYLLVELIGTGGMSEVWRAVDERLDRPVAVKVLHRHLATNADAVARFAVESRRAAQLDHSRIVRILDAGEAGTDSWIVMELVSGPSLRDRIGEITDAQAIDYLIDVADALAAAHAKSVIHRDVKPSNILLDAKGARLADFGIAKALDDATVTATGQFVGTAAFVAPEQALGEPATPASDVFALGCVMFQVLTGRQRFTGENPLQVALQRVHNATGLESVTRPDDDPRGPVPTALAHATVCLLASDPAHRPQDGAAAATMLRDARAGTSVELPPTSNPAVTDPAPTAFESTAIIPVTDDVQGVTEIPAPNRAWDDSEQDAAPRASADGADSRSAVGTELAHRNRWVPVLLSVLGIVLLVVAVVRLVPDGAVDGNPVADSSEPVAGAAGVPVVAVMMTSFDPDGGGSEHEDEVALLTDDDPASAWQTEGYATADFGGLKSGVGIAIDLGTQTSVQGIELSGLSAGQDIQLRTAESAPTSLDGTTVVAEAGDAGSDLALAPDEPVMARWLVVWLTGELPSDGGRFRGQIGELTVLAG